MHGGDGRSWSRLRPGRRFDASAADKPILVFEHVSKSFRIGQPVLRELSLTIERGEFAFITGQSGAGKSTLLRLIYRADFPDAGRILFMGRDVARLRQESVPALRRNLGVVFQDFKLVNDWTVFENVAIALEVVGLPARVIQSRVAETLERVGLAGRGDERAEVLSGGEQQRVGIARAVVHRPRILLADEPTGNLDPELSREIMGLFESFNDVGVTVLIATHDISLIAHMGYDVLTLKDGSFVRGAGAAS